jgi:hypothetical protein
MATQTRPSLVFDERVAGLVYICALAPRRQRDRRESQGEVRSPARRGGRSRAGTSWARTTTPVHPDLRHFVSKRIGATPTPTATTSPAPSEPGLVIDAIRDAVKSCQRSSRAEARRESEP